MNFFKLSDVTDSKKKIKFTHVPNIHGEIEKLETLSSTWDNIMLLDGTRHGLYQYLVWDNRVNVEYFVLLSEDLYTH